MREKMPLVCSDDYGKDADSAKVMLQKHTVLHEQIQAYDNEVVQLRDNGQKMMATIKSNQVYCLLKNTEGWMKRIPVLAN